MIESLGLLAMAAPAGGGSGGAMGGQGMIVWLVLMMGIFYIMMIRPQQRKEKERRKMLEAIKTGDRVVFAGGLMGVVANLKEHTYLVKVSDNVKLEVVRSAVTQVLDKDDKPEDQADCKTGACGK